MTARHARPEGVTPWGVRHRWLGLTTLLSRLGTPLTVLASVLIFSAVAGIILMTAGLLVPVVRTSFVALLSIVFALPYAVKVAQIVRALGRPNARARGLKLERASAPRLYELIDETATRLGARPPGAIWLTMGFDAKTIASRADPDLLLGLPLLDAVSADELRATVAVILARPFTGDGRTAAAYRAGMRWGEVLIPAIQTPARPGANVAALVAAAWVWLLDLEHIAAAREEHARAAASEITGAREVETALARAAIYESYVDDVFWPAVVARHSANEEPPDAITQQRNAVHARLPDDEWHRRWNRARAELKLTMIDPPTQDVDAPRASALVGAAPVFTQAFDATWRAANASNWAGLHQRIGAQAARLDELDAIASRRELTEPEAWQRLLLREAREGTPAVLEDLRAWAVAHPSDAPAQLQAGRGLLSQHDESGIPLIERAIVLDPRYGVEGNALNAAYLRGRGREDEAMDYWKRSEAAAKELNRGLEARTKVHKNVTLSAHGLEPNEVELIAERLRTFRGVKAATLARCETSILPTIPLILIGVQWRRSAFWFTIESPGDVLTRIANVSLPVQVVALDAGKVKPLRRSPAVEIYRRSVLTKAESLARWGRRGQILLIPIALFLVLRASFDNRNCFPDCWLKPEAIFYLLPLIVAINVFLLTGSPDTPPRRAAAFLASFMLVTMLALSGWWQWFTPLPFIALLRVPTTRRSVMWTITLAAPAFLVGVLVANS